MVEAMHLAEIRDLSTNDLLSSYDLTEVEDEPGVVRALNDRIPETACVVVLDLDEARGPLSDPPAPEPEPIEVTEPAESPTT